MDIDSLLADARNALTVRRVFGDPYEKDGVTVIPAARIAGGGGGGHGRDKEGPQGEGAGFGMKAGPAGVFVVQAGEVRWQPAIDPNRVLGTVGAVLIAVVLTRGWVLGRFARSRRRQARCCAPESA